MRNGDRSYCPLNDCAVKSQGRQFISAWCCLCFLHTALLAAPWILLIYRTDAPPWLRIWVCQWVLPFSYTKETLKSYMSSHGAWTYTYLWKNCISSHLHMQFGSLWNGSNPFYTTLVSPSHRAPHKTSDMIFLKGGVRFWLRWWTVKTFSQYLSVFYDVGMNFSKRATFTWVLCWTGFSVECDCSYLQARACASSSPTAPQQERPRSNSRQGQGFCTEFACSLHDCSGFPHHQKHVNSPKPWHRTRVVPQGAGLSLPASPIVRWVKLVEYRNKISLNVAL